MGSFRTPSLTALLIASVAVGAALLSQCNSKGNGAPHVPNAPRAEPAAVPSSRSEPQTPRTTEAVAPAAPDASDAARPTEKAALRVAILGDSLSDGRVGGGGYWKYVKQQCPQSQFDDFGKGGDMVNMMRARFFRDVMNEDGRSVAGVRYTHVVVFGGVNDLYSDLTAGRTVAKIGRDLTRVYQASRKHGARVVAISVAPWGGFTKYFNDRRGQATLRLNTWILSQKSSGEVDVAIDAYPLLSCGTPTHLCKEYAHPIRDGLHFGKKGHEVLGKALYDAAFSDCL